jgi:uncharacterized protein YjdB
VSDNGTDWYGPGVSGTGADVMTIVSFPSTTVQYVRIIQTGSKGNWWSIHEVYAFGNESPVSVAGISLNEHETTLPIGSVHEAQADFLPEDPANKTVFWKSDKTAIAQVDMNGKITGIASGVATITAISMDGIKKTNLMVTVGDGTITSIGHTDPNDFGLTLFPNPASGNVSVSYWLDKPQEVFADVFNTVGINVRTTTFQSNTGENLVTLSVKDFSPGVYFFRLRIAEGTQMKKLVIQQ